MPETTPRIEQQPGAPRVRVAGDWTAASFAWPGLVKSLQEQLQAIDASRSWDLAAVTQLDHIGAQLLWDHWGRRWPANIELHPHQRAVLERVARFTVQAPPRKKKTWRARYLAFGEALLHVVIISSLCSY